MTPRVVEVGVSGALFGGNAGWLCTVAVSLIFPYSSVPQLNCMMRVVVGSDCNHSSGVLSWYRFE